MLYICSRREQLRYHQSLYDGVHFTFQEGTWVAGPLPSERAVLDVVSFPSSENRSQSEESSSPVPCEGANVDAPSCVNSLAATPDATEPACSRPAF